MFLYIIQHQPRRLEDWGLEVYLTSFYTDRSCQLLAPAAFSEQKASSADLVRGGACRRAGLEAVVKKNVCFRREMNVSFSIVQRTG